MAKSSNRTGRQPDGPTFLHANASFVTDRIALGGDLDGNYRMAAEQLDELVAAGITHIADLRSEWSDELLVQEWAPDVEYLHLGVRDAGQTIPPEWFDELASWARNALADPDAKVFVHCHMGVNRAPSAVLAVLLDQGFELRAALDRIRAARPIAVIDYAGSVLSWYFNRMKADTATRHNTRRVLVRWREANGLNPEDVIRQLRSRESAGARWAVRLGPDDPQTLAGLLQKSGEVAVGLAVDHAPDELGHLDELLLLTDGGLTGRALVVGPASAVETGRLLMPVLVTDLFAALELQLPDRVADWMTGRGPNPLLLEREEYRALTSRASLARQEHRDATRPQGTTPA